MTQPDPSHQEASKASSLELKGPDSASHAAEPWLREAAADDWPGVERLLVEAALPTVGAREHLADFFVAGADAQLIGCVGLEYHRDVGLVRSLAVSAAWRGRGVARRLMIRLLRESRERGVKRWVLITTTARPWFERMGFALVERSAAPTEALDASALGTACPAAAQIMVLNGSP